MKVDKLTLGVFAVNCYLVIKENKVVIIDPGAEFEQIVKHLTKNGLDPVAIINTHGHYDHIGAVNKLTEKYKIDFYIHPLEEDYLKNPHLNLSTMVGNKPYRVDSYKIMGRAAIKLFKDMGFNILHTPGHTPGSISIFSDGKLFCGDLLFKGAVGRKDLPGGNLKNLKNSLKKIRKLDKNLVIYPGHGHQTSLEQELESNDYLKDKFLGKE